MLRSRGKDGSLPNTDFPYLFLKFPRLVASLLLKSTGIYKRRWWHKILYIALESILALFKAAFMNKTITALLAGIVIGILIAPDKGSETVRKLRSRVNDYKDQAADKATEFADKGKEAFRNGRDQLNEELD